MKTLLPLLIILTPCFTFSQTRETFDLLMYSAPEGWKEEAKPGVISYTTSTTGTWCRFIIYKSTPGSGNSQQDFRHEWDELVIHAFGPDQPPQQVQEQHASEWNINAGTSTFMFNENEAVVMLTTMSDASTVISLLFVFNDESYLTDIEKFMQSVEIVRPPQSVAQAVAQSSASPAGKPPGLIGKWGRASSATHDKVIAGNGGYSKCVYNFKSDGTYVFKQRTFSMAHQSIILVKESGNYSISGNRITVSPARSVGESWSKKNGVDELGVLEKSSPRNLEPVTYQYSFHFFEGLNEWNLVLQSEKENGRDGAFSTNTTYPNAWYLDQKYLDKEMDEPTIR